MTEPLVIMPVKDSLDTAERAIRSVVGSGYTITIFDDYSSDDNALQLDELADELHIKIVHLKDITSHPSPNYLLVLQSAQRIALERVCDLIIVESDVIVRPDTLHLLQEAVKEGVGMVAAVTENEQGEINYPYEFLPEKYNTEDNKKLTVESRKHLSFCCSLLSNSFLQTFSFCSLNPKKNWYDVTISHKSVELGFRNLLMPANRVLHLPHSSRPWKKLKYKNPLLYYWRKLTQKRDRI